MGNGRQMRMLCVCYWTLLIALLLWLFLLLTLSYWLTSISHAVKGTQSCNVLKEGDGRMLNTSSGIARLFFPFHRCHVLPAWLLTFSLKYDNSAEIRKNRQVLKNIIIQCKIVNGFHKQIQIISQGNQC